MDLEIISKINMEFHDYAWDSQLEDADLFFKAVYHLISVAKAAQEHAFGEVDLDNPHASYRLLCAELKDLEMLNA